MFFAVTFKVTFQVAVSLHYKLTHFCSHVAQIAWASFSNHRRRFCVWATSVSEVPEALGTNWQNGSQAGLAWSVDLKFLWCNSMAIPVVASLVVSLLCKNENKTGTTVSIKGFPRFRYRARRKQAPSLSSLANPPVFEIGFPRLVTRFFLSRSDMIFDYVDGVYHVFQ